MSNGKRMYGRVDENQTGKGSEEVQLKLYYTNQLPNFGLWLIFREIDYRFVLCTRRG